VSLATGQDVRLSTPSNVRSGAAVGVAMAFANGLQYVLQLVASRHLAPAAFGGFGALLGLGVVGAVPMLALQTVAARHIALRESEPAARRATAAQLLSTARRLALWVCALALLSAPLVAAFLHVPVVAALWLGASLGPLAVAGTAQGLLQGRQRFVPMAALVLAVAFLRVSGGIIGLLVSPDVTGGLAGTALGAAAGGLLAHLAVRSETAASPAAAPPGFRAELTAAGYGVLALLALTGTDLLLARHSLGGTDSGRYAAGSLVARGCFWLPQFVAVLAVPRLASGEVALVRRAAGLVAAFGAVEVLGALLAPAALVRLVLGPSYGSLAHRLALFAALGACLAVLQLLLYADIARGVRAVAHLLWAAVAAEAVLVLVLRPGLVGVITTALCCTAAALLAALASAGRERS
jgi:hypothetical protein